MIIYKLSPVLGGRSEVLETPILEALHMMILQNQEKERESRTKEIEGFLDFLKMTHSHPLQTDDNEAVKQRESFIESIRPDFGDGHKKQTKKFTWDEETQAKIDKIEQEKLNK